MPPVGFSNNDKSASTNAGFVAEAISELLFTNRIFEKDALPLSVSVQSSGKKSSFLNLRLINKHSWKQRVKFEDLKIALNFLDAGHFMLLFDIKSG